MDKNFCFIFPQLAENIFEKLDNPSLVNCKTISHEWNNFLTTPKLLLMRKIRKIVETRRKFRNPWKIVSRKISTKIIEELEIASRKFFEDDKYFQSDFETDFDKIDSESNCLTPIHIAASTGNFNLYEALIEKAEEMQPKGNII